MAVAHDDRVRLKCSACGKTGSMPAADFTKLRESGRRATCPSCKSPMDNSSAVHATPASTPGGTISSRSRVIPASEATIAQGPTDAVPTAFAHPAARLANMLGPAPQPEREAQSRCRLRAARDHSRAPVTVGHAAAWLRDAHRTHFAEIRRGCRHRHFPELDQLGAWTAGPRNPIECRSAPAICLRDSGLDLGRHRHRRHDSAIAGRVRRLTIRPDTEHEVDRHPAAPKPAVAGSEPESAALFSGASFSGRPLLDRLPLIRPRERRQNLPVRPSRQERRALRPDTVRPSRRTSRSIPAVNPQILMAELAQSMLSPSPLVKNRIPPDDKKVATAQTAFADGRFDGAILQRKPASATVTLEKLLRRLVVLRPDRRSGRYVQPRTVAGGCTAGPRKWMATERRVGPTKDSSELELFWRLPVSGARTEARRSSGRAGNRQMEGSSGDLDLMGRKRRRLRARQGRDPRKGKSDDRKVGYTHKGFVEYETLMVTPEGSKPARGDVEQWEKVGRMNWVAHRSKRR